MPAATVTNQPLRAALLHIRLQSLTQELIAERKLSNYHIRAAAQRLKITKNAATAIQWVDRNRDTERQPRTPKWDEATLHEVVTLLQETSDHLSRISAPKDETLPQAMQRLSLFCKRLEAAGNSPQAIQIQAGLDSRNYRKLAEWQNNPPQSAKWLRHCPWETLNRLREKWPENGKESQPQPTLVQNPANKVRRSRSGTEKHAPPDWSKAPVTRFHHPCVNCLSRNTTVNAKPVAGMYRRTCGDCGTGEVIPKSRLA